MPHVHIGIVEFTTVALNVVIFTFLWRALSAHLVKNDRTEPLGRALAAVYS